MMVTLQFHRRSGLELRHTLDAVNVRYFCTVFDKRNMFISTSLLEFTYVVLQNIRFLRNKF
jgi:hypothetical protein